MSEVKVLICDITEVDVDALTLYNPAESNDITKQQVVKFGETAFVVKEIGIDRVLLDLPEDVALLLQNRKEDSSRDPDDPVTGEELELGRAFNVFNVTAVRLGLVKPQLDEADVESLPMEVLRKLSDVITGAPTDEETE